MKVRRPTLVVGLCATAIAIGGASVAWACTPNAHVAVGPTAGVPGSQATVTLRSFHADRPVEVRWDTTSGQLLQRAPASATGGSSVQVTIPDVPGGVYYVVGVQFDDQRNIIGQNSASFEVSAPVPAPVSGTSGPPAETPPSPATDPIAAPPTAGPAPSPISHGSPAAQTPSPAAAPSSAPAPAAARPSGDATAGPAPAAGTRPAATRAPVASRTTAPTQGSPPAATAAAPVETASPEAAAASSAGPSRRSATADLWSGFSEGDGSSATGPSLTSPVGVQRDGGGVAVGVALLTLGLGVLASGFGVAVVRRRRAPVASR